MAILDAGARFGLGTAAIYAVRSGAGKNCLDSARGAAFLAPANTLDTIKMAKNISSARGSTSSRLRTRGGSIARIAFKAANCRRTALLAPVWSTDTATEIAAGNAATLSSRKVNTTYPRITGVRMKNLTNRTAKKNSADTRAVFRSSFCLSASIFYDFYPIFYA